MQDPNSENEKIKPAPPLYRLPKDIRIFTPVGYWLVGGDLLKLSKYRKKPKTPMGLSDEEMVFDDVVTQREEHPRIASHNGWKMLGVLGAETFLSIPVFKISRLNPETHEVESPLPKLIGIYDRINGILDTDSEIIKKYPYSSEALQELSLWGQNEEGESTRR